MLKLLLIFCLCCVGAFATTLTGTLPSPLTGTASGTLTLALPQPATVSPTCSGSLPGGGLYNITLTSGVPNITTVVGNDCLIPSSSVYAATFTDTSGNLFTALWRITGSTFSLSNQIFGGPGINFTQSGNAYIQLPPGISLYINSLICGGSGCSGGSSGPAGGDLAGTYPNPTVGHVGNAVVLAGIGFTPLQATAAAVIAQFSGSCPSGVVCLPGSNGVLQTVLPFPYSYQHGTFLGAGLGTSGSTAAAAQVLPGVDIFTPTAACTAANSSYFFSPVGGYLRNVTGTTLTTNGNAFLHFFVNPGCSFGASLTPNGGAVVLPGAPAGGVVDSFANNPTEWWHVNQWLPIALGFARQGSTTGAVPSSIGAEYISDDGTSDTIFSYSQSATALSASATNFIGFGSFINAAELNIAIPIPAPGALKNFSFSFLTSPTNNVVVTVRKNGSNTTLTSTITGGDTSVGNYVDVTHSVSVAAGDYLDIAAVTGASTQVSIQAAALAFVPTVNQTALLWGSFNGATSTSTPFYAQPFSASNVTTEANVEYTFPFACTVSNLYVTQATTNPSGVSETITVIKNGSPTIITGSVPVSSGTGVFAVDTTHSVAFSAGDRMSVERVATGGTSGILGGWGATCL